MDTANIFEILLYIAAAWILYSRFAPVKGLQNLTSQPFKEALGQNKNKFLIDVREPHEFQEGFIPGAVNIPLSQLKSKISAIPNDKPIYLYCRSGMRSKKAARILVKNRFENLSHLQGGIMSWDGKIKK